MAITGDHGLTLIEPAPYGVIGAITPTTNPTETIICNAIGMLAAGNSVVFNAHPYAKNARARRSRCSTRRSSARAGRPTSSPASPNPTIEIGAGADAHPAVRLLVVTGGAGVVKAAMAQRQAGDLRGPGQSAGRRRRDRRPREGGARHRPRRLARQQHHLHRREGSDRRRVDRRRAARRDGAQRRRRRSSERLAASSRRSSSGDARAAPARRRSTRSSSARTPRVILEKIGITVPDVDRGSSWSKSPRTTRSSGPSR